MVYVIQFCWQLASRISSFLILLASCQQTCMTYTISVCTLKEPPDDGQRNCPKHVESYSKNKFEKLVHLVGFIIRILTMHNHLNVKFLKMETVRSPKGQLITKKQTRTKLFWWTHVKDIVAFTTRPVVWDTRIALTRAHQTEILHSSAESLFEMLWFLES
jgi:hypothetical protein